jgi:hypothetical protein
LSHVGKPAPLLALRAQYPFGLGYDPDLVEAIQHETRDMLLPELKAEVHSRREAIQLAAKQTTGEVLPAHAHPDVQFAHHRQGARAEHNGISRRQQVKLDRLARDYPTLHASVIAGDLSAHAAAKAAGFVTDPAPLTLLRRAWRKATPEERAAFLADIMEDAAS